MWEIKEEIESNSFFLRWTSNVHIFNAFVKALCDTLWPSSRSILSLTPDWSLRSWRFIKVLSQVLEVCKQVTELDLTDWKARIEGKGTEVPPEVKIQTSKCLKSLLLKTKKARQCFPSHIMIYIYIILDPQDEERKVLTVGTLGHPNVGKSSLINSLLGKKQVT